VSAPSAAHLRALWSELGAVITGRRDAVLRFVEDLAVPFDNSEAERDLRTMKVEQEVSGGFRAPAGAADFCALRSYLVTARKQRVSALAALRGALAGAPFLHARH
jgi:hypothetical protein